MSRTLPSRGLLLMLRAHHRRLRRLSSRAAEPYSGERRRGHDEESKAVKVSVWWDFQRCQLPPGTNACRVGPRVTAALRAAGIRGPVDITAFGDVIHLPRGAREALAATGVAFSHVPPSGKDGSDRSFMAGLVYWIAQNPPPAHFFLISGDKHFANILHCLRMSNYNILLACPSTDSSVLCSAATIMWPWEALVKGEDFSPKHLNQPPDGLYCSWYGHYRGALDDPFLNTESEDFMALPSHTKPHVIPMSVVNGIRHVLDSYSEGVSLPDLRSELKRNNVFMDKGLFGFKKLSTLLQSLPDIVKFLDPLPGENQPIVLGTYKRSVDPAEQSFKRLNSSQSNVGEKHLNETINEKPPSLDVPSSPSELLSTDQKKTLAADVPSDPLSRDQRKAPPIHLITRSEPPASRMGDNVVTAAATPSSSGAQGAVSKKGLFERIWILWNGPEPLKPEVCPSHDGLPSQHADITDQPKRLLKRILKNFTRTDNSDGKDLDSTSAFSTNLSNISSSGHSSKSHGKENLAHAKSCSNKSVYTSKAEQIDGYGENNKGIFSWGAWWLWRKQQRHI